MGCASCEGQIIYSPILKESYCVNCGTTIEPEPKYPEITLPQRFSITKEKLGCAPPKKLLAYQRLKRKNLLPNQSTKEERRLRRAMAPYQLVSGSMRLDKDVKNSAAFKYKRAVLKGQLKGRNAYAMALAAIGSTCSGFGLWLDLKKTAEIFELNSDKVNSCYDALGGRKRITEPLGKEWVPGETGNAILNSMFALNINPLLVAEADTLFHRLLRQKSLKNKSYETVAAYAVAKVCEDAGNKPERNRIAKAFGVSERSIRRMEGVKIEKLTKQKLRTAALDVLDSSWKLVTEDETERLITQLISTRNIKPYTPPEDTVCIVDKAPGWDMKVEYFQPVKRPIKKYRITTPPTFTYTQCLHCLRKEQLVIMDLRWCLDCGRTYVATRANV